MHQNLSVRSTFDHLCKKWLELALVESQNKFIKIFPLSHILPIRRSAESRIVQELFVDVVIGTGNAFNDLLLTNSRDFGNFQFVKIQNISSKINTSVSKEFGSIKFG